MLKLAGKLPDIVLTSPLVRARETAEEFCKAGDIPGEIIQSWLASRHEPGAGDARVDRILGVQIRRHRRSGTNPTSPA